MLWRMNEIGAVRIVDGNENARNRIFFFFLEWGRGVHGNVNDFESQVVVEE